MSSPGNQHCANCIGTLSFRIVDIMLRPRCGVSPSIRHGIKPTLLSTASPISRQYICKSCNIDKTIQYNTRSSAIAEGPRDASCQLKFYQL